VLWGFQLHLI